jgi:phage-related baseplate assembly protein
MNVRRVRARRRIPVQPSGNRDRAHDGGEGCVGLERSHGAESVATDEALTVATNALRENQDKLRPLFDHVAVELAARRG